MTERTEAGLLALAEVVLALIGVYGLTVLLLFPLLPVTRTLEWALESESSGSRPPADLLRAVDEAGVAGAVRLEEAEGQLRLVLDGVRDVELATAAVSRILAESGYGSAVVEQTAISPDHETLFRLDGRLPAMLALQSAVFLVAGWLLATRRVGRAEPARVSRLVAIVAGVTGGAVTLVLSGIVASVLERIGLPVREQAWVEDLLAEPDAVARIAPWMVLVGPVAEEVFFRGYAFRLLSTRAGRATGYLASSLLFGIIHLNLSGLPVYVLIGLAFCWLYRRTGSLWAPIAAHVTLNGLVILIAVASGAP